MAYGSAEKLVLAQMGAIQAQAFIVCLGEIKTSSVCALQVEAGEMPVRLRRRQLLVYCWINLRGH